MKYYHASKIRHYVGEVLVPKHDEYGGGMGIYMTASPYVHSTISHNGKYFVYQVLPLHNKVRRGNYDDLVAPFGVEILKYVGQFDSNKKSSEVRKNKTIVLTRKSPHPRYVIGWDYYMGLNEKLMINKFRKGSNNLMKLKKYLDKINEIPKSKILGDYFYTDKDKNFFHIFDRRTNKRISVF